MEIKVFTDKLSCQLDADQFNFRINHWMDENVGSIIERKVQFFESSRAMAPPVKGASPNEPCVQCVIALFYECRTEADDEAEMDSMLVDTDCQ
jgi:hypothetical protein